MPQMYRAGGIRKVFRSIEEGTKAGFYPSFNAMARANKDGEKVPEIAPAPVSDTPEPAPVPPVAEAPAEDAPPAPPAEETPAPQAKRPCPDMSLDEVRAVAEENGLDTSVHHMTLRAQVEEILNAKSGSD